MDSTTYGICRDIEATIDELRPKVEAALKAEGFGILTEINVKATLKKKLDIDVPGQLILGSCNPKIAHAALEKEPELGLLLPCNVTLRELPDGRTRVAAVDAIKMLGITGNPILRAQAEEAAACLERAIAAVGD